MQGTRCTGPGTRALIGAVAIAAGLAATAHPAAAQTTGSPVENFVVTGGSGVLFVGPTCDAYVAQSLGGLTLVGAVSPNGAPLGHLQQPVTVVETIPQCPVFIVPGVPAGTYWVTVVYGRVTSANVPVSSWKQVVVGGGCTTVPLPPLLLPGQPVITGNQVSIGFGNQPVCPATSIVVEVGSQPGRTDIPPIHLSTLGISTVAPPGTYYVRARGRNSNGIGNPSIEVPVKVPNTCAGSGLPQGPINLTANVSPGAVQLTWTQTFSTFPTTFYVLTIKDPATGRALDNRVLPNVRSFGGPVPPGTYRISLAGGNECGLRAPITGDLTFTVP
jgi:hypothetical protein